MKRIVLYSAAVLCLLAVLCGPVSEGRADALYIKKIVHVVLDDSGSMGDKGTGSRWDYALYALQTLTAMMNPGDELYLTPLNHRDRIDILDVSDSKVNDTLKTIRNMSSPSGLTPFEAVVNAFNSLKQRPGSDNTEYYLIVITDGEFYLSGKNDLELYKPYKSAQDAFDHFIADKTANGTHPKVVFMGIGSSVTPIKANEAGGLYVYSADEQDGIIRVMDQISDRISGRKRFSQKDFHVDGSGKITVSSPDLPLSSIIVMTQNSDATVKNVKASPNQSLRIAREAHPETSLGFFKSIYSNIVRIESSAGNIQPGEYTISFNKDVDPSAVVVLFEPALEIHPVFTLNGHPATQEQIIQTACVGDEVTVTYRITEAGTDKEIPLGKIIDADAGVSYTDPAGQITKKGRLTITLPDGRVSLGAWLQLPGFKPLEDGVTFMPTKKIDTPAVSVDGKQTMTVGEFRREGISLRYTLRIDHSANGVQTGSTMLKTAQEVKSRNITLDTGLPYDQKRLYGTDGRLHLYVDPSAGLKEGTYTIRLLWDGVEKDVSQVTLTPSGYTLSISPPTQSKTRVEYRLNPPVYTFSLLEDGSFPVSCETAGLKVDCAGLKGSLTFDSQGNGLYTFSGTADVGTYTLSAKADVPLAGDTQATLEITRSDAVLTFEQSVITRPRGSLDGSGIAFIASMTADGYDLPFEDGQYTLTAPSLPGNPKAEILPDGRLKISLTPGLETLPGDYGLNLSAEGASAEAKLTVTPSVFAVSAAPPEISLVTDYLYKNTDGILFTVTADGHPLTGEAMTILGAAVGTGSLKTDNSFAGDSVTVTPTLEKGSPLPDDGRYPVTVTLSSGESATAYVNLTMRSFTVVPEGNGYSLHREGLVKNNQTLTFRILENGRAMTREEIEELYLAVSADAKHQRWVENRYEILPDGSVAVTVFRKGGFFGYIRGFIASLTPLGDMTVTLSVNRSAGSSIITLHRGDFWQEWLPYRIIPALILAYLVGMIVKKRFPLRTRLYYCSAQKNSANQLPITGNAWFAGPRLINLWCLVPYAADRRSIKGTGIRLRAAGGGVEYLCPPPSPNAVCYQFQRSKNIRPYEKGVLSVSALKVTDPPRPNGKNSPRWHSFGAGIGLVFFDGSQYNIIIKQSSKRK